MADGLKRERRTEDGWLRVGAPAPRLLISVLCLLSSAFCCAEELHDPTRPPASLAASGTARGVAPWQGATAGRASGLQTTIISKSRRAAIIDGKTVELGGKHGNARLVEVNEGSVVLQGEKTRQVLTLFPDVKMTPRALIIKTLSPDSGLHPNIPSTKPVAQDEKPLPVKPQEEK